MTAEGAKARWALEVVRGREPGRRFVLDGPSIVLGASPGNSRGLALAEQEEAGPRRMGDRHALLDFSDGRPRLSDLESASGTFVNRRRILPGESFPLTEGDLIDLGRVRLRLVANSQTAARPAPKPVEPSRAAEPGAKSGDAPPRTFAGSPFAYVLAGGPTCRTPDDFLAVASQHWDKLREELGSGRLARGLRAAGRPDLAPAPAPAKVGTPDERLDDWLAALPTSRPVTSAIDVHPLKLKVAGGPGGSSSRTIRVANVGHRLLRWRARVEPGSVGWLRIVGGAALAEVQTIQESELVLEVDFPDRPGLTRAGGLLVESGGETIRVEVVVGPKAVRDATRLVPGADRSGGHAGFIKIAAVPLFLASIAGAWLVWMLVGLGARLVAPPAGVGPGLAGPAVVFAGLGGIICGLLALIRGRPADAGVWALGGGVAGLLAASLAVATAQTFEGWLPEDWWAAKMTLVVLWGGLGASAAGFLWMASSPGEPSP